MNPSRQSEVSMRWSRTRESEGSRWTRQSDRLRQTGSSWETVMKKLIPAIVITQKFKEAAKGGHRRKSFSNPENIENFSDKDNNARLEEHMKLQHLEQLMQAFQTFEPPDIVIQEATKFFPAKLQKRTPGAMNITEFKSTVNKVIATNEYDEYLEKLFQKLDTSCTGYVDWNEFCTYMLLLYRENDYMRTKKEIPFLVEPKIRHIVHNKQEQTTKVLASSNPTRYVSVSKEGNISVWNSSLNFEKSYTIDEDEGDQSGPKRRFKMWVTDAVYMPNCNKLALASTSRDIRFFDCSTNQWFEEYHLFAMSDVPYCLDYWYDKKHPNSKSVLIFGVDTGAIHILYFHKPVSQLFETAFKSDGGAQKIFWKEIEKEGSHVRYVEHEKILHDKVQQIPPNLIRQVQYIADKNSIISSSSSSSRSIVISDVHKLKKQYVFNIEKGIECFDYNKNQNLLVTGGLDHIVRLWNAYVTTKPIATLEGHATGVIGCKIHEGLMQVFTYSKDAVVKVWDFREHTCLQSIVLKFPSSIHGRMPEHGQFPMHLQPSPHDALLVTCNDYMGMLKLGTTSIPQQLGVTTHDTQLCCAIYNPLFKQVVTGCDSSNVAVWDLESGNKSIVFSNAHGDEEITAMVFDESWRRLITGARNGSIKVWNFQNGHNLHKLEAVGEAEVTGIVSLTEKQVILAVGWSRKIVQYNDADPDNMYIPADTNWKGRQLHEDDILSLDYCLPYYLATAGFDGEITVWDIETEKVFVRLRKGQKSDIAKKIASIHEPQTFLSSLSSMSVTDVNEVNTNNRSSASSSRPNSRHRKSHKVQKGQPVPVDKLLFLRNRCSERYLDTAMLISSEAGYLRWWTLFGVKHEMGLFYVPDSKDESVLALCTNEDNTVLFSGDTVGFIKVWDITDYCTKPQERRVRTCPPLISSWKAHDSAVVSVELIVHETGQYVLTASTDKTARLWTSEGLYIGTFGQKRNWNLKKKSTWVHPRTPWTEQNTQNGPADNKTENGQDEDKDRPSEDQEEAEVTTEKVEDKPKYMEEITQENFQKELQNSVETFLGSKVANQLQQMKSCRIDRRKRLTEDIDFNITQRYGKLCSPFQALKTKDVVEVRFPDSLPLSQRMINKGYKSENMTEEVLKNMDFSYGGPDSPPSGDQEKKAAPKQDKAYTAGTKRTRQISAIKKTNTVA